MYDYKKALQNFVDLLTERTNIFYAKYFPNQTPPTYKVNTHEGIVESGVDRIVSIKYGRKAAYCFIYKKNGDIYRPNGYSKVGNKIVNNIYKDDPLSNTEYGESLLHLSETV